jgi:hypothetical protein
VGNQLQTNQQILRRGVNDDQDKLRDHGIELLFGYLFKLMSMDRHTKECLELLSTFIQLDKY